MDKNKKVYQSLGKFGRSEIENVTALSPLKNLSITELWLDGNPLCQNYDEQGYIDAVKEAIPTIEKIDGVLLGQHGFPAFRRNYLVDGKAQDFIDQFMEHFFSLYDTNDRKCLQVLYHRNALFSLTCNYLPSQSTSSTAKLINYKSISRNSIALSDLSKTSTLLFTGSQSIINQFCKLPLTEHDPYTFTVDCVHFTEEHAVITIHGVFREPPETLLESERVLGFARTFVLKHSGRTEWNIVNDMLHVTNATTVMAQKAFKIAKPTKPFRFDHNVILEANIPEEKERMSEVFRKITTLNDEWTKKCLEARKWNFRDALTLFVDMYKVDRIPAIAFEGDVAGILPSNSSSSEKNNKRIETVKRKPVLNLNLKNVQQNKNRNVIEVITID